MGTRTSVVTILTTLLMWVFGFGVLDGQGGHDLDGVGGLFEGERLDAWLDFVSCVDRDNWLLLLCAVHDIVWTEC